MLSKLNDILFIAKHTQLSLNAFRKWRNLSNTGNNKSAYLFNIHINLLKLKKMEKLELSTLHIAHLSNEDAGGLFKLSCDIALTVQSTIGELLSASVTKLKAHTDPFILQINKQQKSELTDKVVAARSTCNTLFAEIKRCVVFESKSRDTVKKNAALKLDFFLEAYRDITKSPLATQLEMSAGCCAKYNADTGIQLAGTTIGIDVFMAEFENANNALGVIYKARNEEISQRETSGTELRQPASKSYQQFCTVLEEAVNLTPNPSIIQLFNNINELRKKYHALLPKRKGKGGEEPIV